MRFGPTITSMKLRLVLLLSASLVTLSLATAPHAAAVTCTVPTQFLTIQAAIANPPCTLITVKAGTYIGPITIDRDLTLRGAGPKSIITPGAALVAPKAIIRVTGAATNAIIEKFTIKGPGDGPCDSLEYGVFVDGDASATIRNNVFTAIRDEPLGGCQNGNAIQVGRNALGTTGHAVITGNDIDDYQKTGIAVDNNGSSATITSNVVTGSGFRTGPLAAQNGILVARNADATVSKNTVTDNMYDPNVAASGGILLFDAGNIVTVSSNTLTRNDVGVWVIGTSNVTVKSNKVKDSTFDGIALDNQSGNPVTLNTVSKNQVSGSGDGIGLYGAEDNTIDSNTATTSIAGPGFFVAADSTGNTLTKNRANNNSTFGMEDESAGLGTAGTGNTYSGNHCTGNASGKSAPPGLC